MSETSETSGINVDPVERRKSINLNRYPIKETHDDGDYVLARERTKPVEVEPLPEDFIPEEGITFFFDIDNCLYSQRYKIHELMGKYIHRYFVKELHLDDETAEMLHLQYYKQYGLALEGLVRFHEIDALEYNKEVDDALPLEDILKEDKKLRQMIEGIDRSKVRKLWLFTNAYVNHAKRVVKILGIDDLFDGVTYCDYSKIPIVCKPMKEMFDKALREAGVTNPSRECYYVDDSFMNIRAAKNLGWRKTIHYVDSEFSEDEVPKEQAGSAVIRNILNLINVVPEIFKPEALEEMRKDPEFTQPSRNQ